MKTYLFDTINRYKRFSENLDVSATLCNKSWWLFNDEEVKSLYIFLPNGDLYTTTNGVGLKGSWQYISANKTVIINSDNKVMMFHPVFVDDNILTLTLDGTQNCAFLIDENNRAKFSPRSLSDLIKYFQDKEQREIEAKQKEEEVRRRAAEELVRIRAVQEREIQRAAEEKARHRVSKRQNGRGSSRLEQSHDESSSNSSWILHIILLVFSVIIFFASFFIGATFRRLCHQYGWSDGIHIVLDVINIIVMVFLVKRLSKCFLKWFFSRN